MVIRERGHHAVGIGDLPEQPVRGDRVAQIREVILQTRGRGGDGLLACGVRPQPQEVACPLHPLSGALAVV